LLKEQLIFFPCRLSAGSGLSSCRGFRLMCRRTSWFLLSPFFSFVYKKNLHSRQVRHIFRVKISGKDYADLNKNAWSIIKFLLYESSQLLLRSKNILFLLLFKKYQVHDKNFRHWLNISTSLLKASWHWPYSKQDVYCVFPLSWHLFISDNISSCRSIRSCFFIISVLNS